MLGLEHFPRVLLHVGTVDLNLGREERDAVDESEMGVTERAAYASSQSADGREQHRRSWPQNEGFSRVDLGQDAHPTSLFARYRKGIS